MNAADVAARLALTDLSEDEKQAVRDKLVAGSINPLSWVYVTNEELAQGLRNIINEGRNLPFISPLHFSLSFPYFLLVSDSKATLDQILHTVEKQALVSNTFLRAFINSKKKRALSTASEHQHHQATFALECIARYGAQSPTSPQHVCCAILGLYIVREHISAVQLCSLDRQDALEVLGKEIDDKWEPQNGVLMHREIEKHFNALEVTLLYEPQTHTVKFHVLFDDIMMRQIVPDFTVVEDYSVITNAQKKKIRKAFHTFADIDGRVLTLPPLTLPSRTVLHWAAESAYEAALRSKRPHACATASVPTVAQWAVIKADLTPTSSRLSAYLEDTPMGDEGEDSEGGTA